MKEKIIELAEDEIETEIINFNAADRADQYADWIQQETLRTWKEKKTHLLDI